MLYPRSTVTRFGHIFHPRTASLLLVLSMFLVLADFNVLPGLGAASRAHADTPSSTILPYGSAEWRYQNVPGDGLQGFEAPDFDDSSWPTGSAPFGRTGYGCPLEPKIKTDWPPDSDMVIRRQLGNLPSFVTDVHISIAVDNDVDVFWNGQLIGSAFHDFCAEEGSLVFDVLDTDLNHPIYGNVLAVRGRDRGVVTYLDVEVTWGSGGLFLTAESAHQPAGYPNTVTANYADPSTFLPIYGVPIRFSVTSGPNTGVEGFACTHRYTIGDSECRTDSIGQVQWRYTTGPGLGRDTIFAFADSNENGIRDAGEPGASTFTDWLEPIKYVAMGDSYSAGEGVEPFYLGTDEHNNKCHRSGAAYSTYANPVRYPSPLINDIEPVDWDFIACSGAITDDVIIDPQRPGDGYAQTDNPKFTSQTNMVTLTIGGNDAGFASVVKNCALSNCLTFSPWDAVFGLPMEFWLPQKIDGLYDEILATYQEIKQKAPDAVVFILTYPQVFPDSVSEQTCIGLRPFNTSEQDFLRAMGTRLNDVIAQAAADAGVHQFDVVQHWADHEVCGNGGQWINGFVSGLPDFKPVGNAAFHPNFKGQYEYSVDLQRGIDGLVDGGAPLAPTGLPQNPAGQIASAGNQAATAATTTDPGSVTDLVVEPVAAPGLRCEGTLALGEQMEATASGFQPSTSVTLTLEQPDASYSRTLATAQSDANGDIDVTATIPTDAPDGMGASIYAVGTNPNGDAHLAYTTAGLAATPPDCDHDAPSITIVAPASGATYQLDEPVDADFSCDDGAGTGVDQCLGSSPAGFPIDTSIPGDHEFTVRASDLEHNVAERTVTYHVDYGIPVANAGIDAVVTDGDRNGSQAVTLDGTGSTSPDGDVISYSWSEGGTHLATGATPTIVLPVGSHTITLTVNDWKGATATDAVAVKVNRPPTANAGPDQTVYDNDSNGSQPAVLNGSGSSDPDGSVATYTWTEGATQIATGVSPTVTLSLGSHTLTLLAADNDGGTATDTVVVTVSPAALAQDTFTRSATAGWGTADFGGAWTVLAGTPTNFSVDGARGVVTAPSGGAAQLIGLVTAVNRDVDMTATVTFPSVLDGEAGFLVVRRQTGGAYYRLGLGVSVPRGKPSALLIRGETNAGTKLFNPFATGLGVAAGDQFRLRIQAQGASPTTLRIRVWRVGTTEPATWAVVTTNKTAAYQTAGSIGAVAFSTSAATVRFDDLVAVKL